MKGNCESNTEFVARTVRNRIDAGDVVKDAVRTLLNEGKIVPPDEQTLDQLRSKHPIEPNADPAVIDPAKPLSLTLEHSGPHSPNRRRAEHRGGASSRRTGSHSRSMRVQSNAGCNGLARAHLQSRKGAQAAVTQPSTPASATCLTLRDMHHCWSLAGLRSLQ